jgi:hypothetical protein
MRHLHLIISSLLALWLPAQGPAVTSWVLNAGNETGYGGYLTNVQGVDYTGTDVYISCTCIPGYDIGPWAGDPNIPSNQNFVFKITRLPIQNTGDPVPTPLGHIAVFRNGVSAFNAEDAMSYNDMNVWHRNAVFFEGASFDDCLGHPAPNGEYHHHVSPDCLYDHLNDQVHSDLIGYAFDGFPIYGAYGYASSDGTGGIARMRSSFHLRSITDRTTLADGTVLSPMQYGPAIGGQYPLGAFIEDYEYAMDSGDLDEHNGRFCVTPDFPLGHYCYFVTLDEQASPAYPYIIGPTYYGTVQPGNTGPQSGHNVIPADATAFDPNGPNAIAEHAGGPALKLFPVPVENELNISIDGEGSLKAIAVLDAEGRLLTLANGIGPQTTIALNSLAPGAYLIQLVLADGRSFVRTIAKR